MATNNEIEIDYIGTTELKQLGAAQQAAGNLATAKDCEAAYHTMDALVRELKSIERGLSKRKDGAMPDTALAGWCDLRLKSILKLRAKGVIR
tara:strand:- start:317 stop:592 length:276 start_codon:yes stop_codon:yes gene_type:complete